MNQLIHQLGMNQNPPNHYSRQRSTMRQQNFPEFLFGTKQPEFILHTALSSKQWTSRGHKQDPNNCLKEEARASQRKLVEELPGVLWAYQTTPGRPTGNTPFALAYSMDAVIHTEIGLPTIRTEAGMQDDANTEL